MTCHVFNIEDAEKYGVDAAIILYNLKFWLDHNKANGTHINDGYVWSYNSAKAMADLFPYWTSNKIQKLMKKLEKDGVVIVGNYNKMAYDKTKWYTLPSYSLQPNGSSLSANRLNPSSEKAQPIPDVITDEIKDIRNTDFSHPEKRTYPIREVYQDYNLDFCIDSMLELEQLKEKGHKVFTGELTLQEWEDCESAMQSVDCFNIEYFSWWLDNKAKGMRKTPSLPNMLCEVRGIPFDQFYDSTFMQEWD